MTESTDPTQETATDEGLADQADELKTENPGAESPEDFPDPRKPDEWRGMNKEGGGA